ncbi:E3 ubiquitin-protein ligase AMFR-like isoform X2 [Littorina saxatilis]|uniref:E3 ubiquitin-protein ligase AMFR n=1 Tax=Littorina saxatilis TaxID=31220 RepID=A0AAN9GQR9_9CAEN
MPAVLLERLPLPSLQTYVTLSVIFLASSLLYTHHTVITGQTAVTLQDAVVTTTQIEEQSSSLRGWIPEPEIKEPVAGEDADIYESLGIQEPINMTLPYDNYQENFLWVLFTEAWCVWTIVNTVYCLLILLGKLIQALIFGELRVSEQQHLKDKFWNFVFYKFIFIFGVMNVQTMEEVVLWVAWFTCLGFLHLLVQLCKDRFEYLSFSPTTPRSAHAKLLGLLLVLMGCSATLLGVCVAAGFKFGLTIFAFMAAECVLLGLKTVYVIVRYLIHLWDLSLESVWENRSVYVYYSELIFELSSLSVDFGHHLHMLLWGNIFLSMASLVICMQLRYLFYEFQRRIKRHKNYRQVVKNMQARFPMATQEDLELNADECAICWESMEAARKLPCGHLFHNSCLRSWLEQDTSCPTCRMTLSERTGDQNPRADRTEAAGATNVNLAEAAAAANQGTTNHFFHFDGSRYVSWLPSFSVEVTHTSLMPGQQLRIQTSQLDSMLRQVQMMFPNFPSQVILDDLRQTRSVEVTIDNILENRLQPSRTIDLAAYREDYWENNPNSPHPQQQQEPQSQEVTRLPTEASHGTDQMAPQAATDSNNFEVREPTEGSQLSDAVSSFTTTSQPFQSQQLVPVEEASPSRDGAVGGEHQIQAQGGRFSKSASERMSMLEQRKNALLEQARRRYLARHSEAGGDGPSSAAGHQSSDDDRVRRREVVLQATQRRLNNS